MNKKYLVLLSICLGAGVVCAVACIQGSSSRIAFEPPKDPRQLPADIFKMHVHIAAEPLQIEIPLLDGTVKRLATKKTTTDPQSDFQSMIRVYEAEPSQHTSADERNDYAAALLFAGRYVDSIKVLVQLERDHPGEYATAANLGTAYELNGDVDKALEWIKTGMDRNADSHEGTEWLHIAILETKQKLRNDSDWLVKHSVLDGHEKRSRELKERALEYQLNERLYFIHDNDPVMCDLMYQAALITADSAKKTYFLKQVPRFGRIRDAELRKLSRS